jgi:hypothetical protein
MAMSGDVNNYIGAIKAKASTVKEVPLAVNDRRQALIEQQNKCAICKKDLNPYYSKYIVEPGSKKGKVICSNCAIPISKR